MTSKKLKEKESESLIDGAKKGDKLKTQIIVQRFGGLIKNNYKNLIRGQVNIDLDDYTQECNLKIIECINKTSKKNYWQLTSLIETSLRNKTVDFKEKGRNFNNSNVPCGDRIDVYNAKKDDETHKFEDLILGDMTVEHIYNTFIKDRLSKEEKNVFCTYIFGEELEDYAKQRGVQIESVKRTVRRVVDKIRSIDQLKEYHYMTLIILVFLKNIQEFIEITDVCYFLGMVAM
jgi:DNA-directed RNA polymerase specialized sigma24 family protein